MKSKTALAYLLGLALSLSTAWLLPTQTSLPPANAQVPTPTATSARQATAYEKVASFGLVPNPVPLIPGGLSFSRNPNEGSRGVIGLTDDRIPMTSRNYPWSAIGRVESPSGAEGYMSICTASLVAPDVVLTNAHCVIDETTHTVKSNLQFKPNLINGQVLDAADVANVVDIIYGTNFEEDNAVPHPNDWAFAKLDKPLGEKYGTLSWHILSMRELTQSYAGKLILVGYSGDFPQNDPAKTAAVHDGCSILGEVEGSLIHNCDTYGGSSGGPILAVINGEFRIVALNSAEYYEEGTVIETGQPIQAGIVNYGVKMTPIVTFLTQATP